MAVAAYEAVVSLMHVLDQIQQYPSRYQLRLDKDQIETLREKVCFLQDFLQVHSQRFYEDLEGLARQIAALTYKAEDIIDSHVVDQLRKGSADQGDMDLSTSYEVIENVIENIESIKKELMIIKGGMTIQEPGPGVSVAARSLAPPSSGNNRMVGFDKQFDQIVLKLTGDKCDLQVLPIVGMGGIGKTTLTRNAFENSYIMHHFDLRTWLTVSQEHSTQRILLGLLGAPGDQKNKERGEKLAKLGEQLYKSLYDRRYLIVLDDIWSPNVWNEIKSFLPDNKNGSRIIVTTRLSSVVVAFGSSNPFLMDFLDEDQSWNLFCEKAFKEEGCPTELEEVGKSIAKGCKGLPLAIVVVGGLLSKSNMTRVYWESIAENVNSFANSGDDEHCLKILKLSYNHLPIHLKPCFLYMREFPEDDEIEVSELIRLWVAQGFPKPTIGKTLEEVAQQYLEDLIGRSLILIREWTDIGTVKNCGIHDLLRDLCIRESHREHFYCAPKVQHLYLEYKGYKECFLCSRTEATTSVDLPRVTVSSQPTSLASCFICDVCRKMYPKLNKLRWVKVIEDEDSVHPTKLRFLFIIHGMYFKFVDKLIHLLWNLQTLIIKANQVVLPSEIWELPQLRHLIIEHTSILPVPPLITQVDRKSSIIILKNLQTLNSIENFRWSENAIERIPNLKELVIHYDNEIQEWSYYSLHNLSYLHKLESLNLDAQALLTLKNAAFPHSLKKLSLQHCLIPWEEITVIGSLPNLEVLKLYSNAFEGPEWNPIEGEFLRLKKLLICNSDLVRWRAEKSHFPILERLELYGMNYLEEIPSGIGEIETLCSISIHYCSKSAINSAKEIQEEEHHFGNEDLQLYVNHKMVLPSSGRFQRHE